MNGFSPIAAGFRMIFRRPAVALGEIAWRWSFAATAWALGGMLVFEYFNTLPVTPLERLLLRTGQPFLVWRALRSVFSGSAFRFTEAAIVTSLGLALAWIVLASLGRNPAASAAERTGSRPIAICGAADPRPVGVSVGQVLQVLQRSPGPMLITVLVFTILQTLGVAAVFGVTLSVLAVAGAHLGGFLFLEFGVLIIYCAIADFLHAAAVAAYLVIMRGEEPFALRESHPITGPGAQSIDRDELILSDAPLPA